ncbi:MAG: hypothetical protein VKN72_20070 [Nostocales cyanobacterium 94392]|nr:hypothetical protein [Nostocales cyanobacterium 94392]
MTRSYQIVGHYSADFNLLFTKCLEVIEICGFALQESNILTGYIVAKTQVSWKSFGEIIEIEINHNGGVKVKSVCIVPTTLIAYGKNQENVERIFAKLDASF